MKKAFVSQRQIEVLEELEKREKLYWVDKDDYQELIDLELIDESRDNNNLFKFNLRNKNLSKIIPCYYSIDVDAKCDNGDRIRIENPNKNSLYGFVNEKIIYVCSSCMEEFYNRYKNNESYRPRW